MEALEITPSNIDKFDIVNDKRSFVKVHHPSCEHCIAMGPAWKELEKNFKKRIRREFRNY